VAIALGGGAAAAQDFSITPPVNPMTELPFAVPPDQLSGPPRAMGELPRGFSQPPSTLIGSQPGTPPRAMGEAPPISPFYPLFPSFTTGAQMGGTSILSPWAAFGGSPARSTALPLFLGGLGGEGVGAVPPEELPQGMFRPVPPELRAITGPPLLLDEVLITAERTYPLFLAVLQDRAGADADILSALGSFDLNLNADSRNYPLGFYNRTLQDVFLELPLFDLGGELFGGYRLATGKWPSYYNYLNTRGSGAFVAGFKVPLLKNRDIDARRAKLFQSEIERRKVEPTILKERIKLRKDAAKTYWYWVGSGQSYLVANRLARLAEVRYEGLRELVERNLVSPIDLETFRLSVVTRQAQLVDARRRLQAAAIELSLFLRDPAGLPLIAEESRLPLTFPAVVPPDAARLEEDVQVALRLRPEIFALRLAARKMQIERQYAQNQMLPSLTAYVYTEQNVGASRIEMLQGDFRPFILESSLLFDVPIQRRFARGRIQAADARLRQIALETRFAADRIRADVQEALTAVDAAYSQLVLFREFEQRTAKLERAEYERLQLNQSNVLNVVIREQATLDAVIKRIESEAKYLAAIAEYRAAIGLDAVPSDLAALATGPNAPAEPPPVPGARPVDPNRLEGLDRIEEAPPPSIPDEGGLPLPLPNTGPFTPRNETPEPERPPAAPDGGPNPLPEINNLGPGPGGVPRSGPVPGR
jgi:outer membrane protein TolC